MRSAPVDGIMSFCAEDRKDVSIKLSMSGQADCSVMYDGGIQLQLAVGVDGLRAGVSTATLSGSEVLYRHNKR